MSQIKKREIFESSELDFDPYCSSLATTYNLAGKTKK